MRIHFTLSILLASTMLSPSFAMQGDGDQFSNSTPSTHVIAKEDESKEQNPQAASLAHQNFLEALGKLHPESLTALKTQFESLPPESRPNFIPYLAELLSMLSPSFAMMEKKSQQYATSPIVKSTTSTQLSVKEGESEKYPPLSSAQLNALQEELSTLQEQHHVFEKEAKVITDKLELDPQNEYLLTHKDDLKKKIGDLQYTIISQQERLQHYKNHFLMVPNEIVSDILSYHTFLDIILLRKVSKSFKTIIDSSVLPKYNLQWDNLTKELKNKKNETIDNYFKGINKKLHPAVALSLKSIRIYMDKATDQMNKAQKDRSQKDMVQFMEKAVKIRNTNITKIDIVTNNLSDDDIFEFAKKLDEKKKYTIDLGMSTLGYDTNPTRQGFESRVKQVISAKERLKTNFPNITWLYNKYR